jgi:hypothetical protein
MVVSQMAVVSGVAVAAVGTKRATSSCFVVECK